MNPIWEKLTDRYLDSEEFLGLFHHVLSTHENAYFLESGEDDRYSYIGFSPRDFVEFKDSTFYENGRPLPGAKPISHLGSYFTPNSCFSPIPFYGGLVGYFSYESMSLFEPTLQLPQHSRFPIFAFGVYRDGIVLDRYTGRMYYYHDGKSRLADAKDLVKHAEEIPHPKFRSKCIGASVDEKKHREMVLETKQEILHGNTFQCQIGFREDWEIQGNPFGIYTKMRKQNPSPYMYYIKNGSKTLFGTSPELMLRKQGFEVETYPLAGTTKRGKNSKEDQELARALLEDQKELAEHRMLIDLHRNDLGRVCRFGSVQVKKAFDIKKFSFVQHISSEVVGLSRYDANAFQCLGAVFPAGTLSGAPKIESMKIIQRIENDPRGPYGGGIGYLGWDDSALMAIPIRSFFMDGECGYVRASGGIVFDSDPASEYQEIQNKMASVRRALENE